MPEIKLGSSANMKNINLGVIELQEVYLGNVLVWQNNLGPAYATLIWDGTTFTLPTRASGEPMEKFTRAFTSAAGNSAGARNITLSLQIISDPDNEREPGTNDYLVGYRLQRPDGTYAAGDPSSSGNNSFNAPIKEFGASLPNASAVWDSVNEEFISGDTTLSVSNIPVALRETDPSGNVVDSTTQTFVDAGDWEIIVVDSRGGESAVGTLEINLIYDAPSGQQVNSITQGGQSAGSAISTSSSSPTSYTNTVVGGPSNAILSFNNTGGPLSTNIGLQYSWSCMSGCSGNSTDPTFQVSIPQSNSGGATPARVRLTTIGRAYNGNVAGVTTVSDVYFRSGPSCSPSLPSTGPGSFGFNPGASAVCATLVFAPTSYNKSCSGTCSGFSAGSSTNRNYSSPSSICGETSTVYISGTTTGLVLGAAGSRGFTGSNPSKTGTPSTWSPSSNPTGAFIATPNPSVSNLGTCPTCTSCAAPNGTSGTCVISARLVNAAPGSFQLSNGSYQYVTGVACTTGGTITNAVPGFSTSVRFAQSGGATASPTPTNCIGGGSVGIYGVYSHTMLYDNGSTSFTIWSQGTCSCTGTVTATNVSISPQKNANNRLYGCGTSGAPSPGDSCTVSGVQMVLIAGGKANEYVNIPSITVTC